MLSHIYLNEIILLEPCSIMLLQTSDSFSLITSHVIFYQSLAGRAVSTVQQHQRCTRHARLLEQDSQVPGSKSQQSARDSLDHMPSAVPS